MYELTKRYFYNNRMFSKRIEMLVGIFYGVTILHAPNFPLFSFIEFENIGGENEWDS